MENAVTSSKKRRRRRRKQLQKLKNNCEGNGQQTQYIHEIDAVVKGRMYTAYDGAPVLTRTRLYDVPDAQLSQRAVGQRIVKTTVMVTDKNAEEYNMNHKNRGKAVIFNHEIFETSLPNRDGTHFDAKRLQVVLEKLHFEVEIHNDLEFGELKNKLKSLQNMDHSENDCILIAVLSHGYPQSQVSARDASYPVDLLWQGFTADSCLTLAGKPKLFIINVCRGDQVDEGIQMMQRMTVTDSMSSSSYRIPTHADFLVAQSTFDGHYSFRDPQKGSWFVQCFCDVLEQYHESTDLLKMLTITARKVAVNYTSYNPNKPEIHDVTQIPSVTTRLIRDIYFRPKC